MSEALKMAVFFHATYERLAPLFGYETREETRQFNPTSNNGRLMQAVCAAWLDKHDARIRELEQRLVNLEDEKNTYIDYVGDALGQDHDGESLWDAAQRVLSDRDRLREQIAAHEKVCAGTWVRCSERLPTRGNCKTRGVHKVTRLLVEQNTNSTWVKDGKVLWFVQPEAVEWEEWLDAKQPDEGVKS